MYKYKRKQKETTPERIGHCNLAQNGITEEQGAIPENMSDITPFVKPKDAWQRKFDAISQALSYTRK